MDKRKFEVGDKVTYLKYDKGVGTVRNYSPSGEFVRVTWPDGEKNGYVENHLKHYKKEEKQMALPPCTNKGCEGYKKSQSDGSNCANWVMDGERYLNCPKRQDTPATIPQKAQLITTKAKGIATSIRTTIKPYEKYLGLVLLALVIDHFLLDGKFAHKFKELAEVIVTKIQSGLDKMTEKLTGEWFTDTPDGDDGEDN